MHTSNLYWVEPQVELAEVLVKQSGLGKAFATAARKPTIGHKLARKYAKAKMGKTSTE